MPKDISSEEKEKLLLDQEGLRKELENFGKNTSILISKFKVNFYSSAIKKIANTMIANQPIEPFTIKLNSDNELFIIPQKDNKLALVYGLNFSQKTDKSLVRVFLQELEDAKRHVKNSVESKFYPETGKPPLELDGVEKNPSRFNSGCVSMSKN